MICIVKLIERTQNVTLGKQAIFFLKIEDTLDGSLIF